MKNNKFTSKSEFCVLQNRRSHTSVFLILFLMFFSLFSEDGFGQVNVFSFSGGGVAPTGWTFNNNVTDESINQTNYWLLESSSNSDVIISNTIDLSIYANATLSFSFRRHGGGSETRAKVEISFNGGSTYTQVATSDLTSNSYETYSLNLSSTTSQVKIKISNNGNTASFRGLRIQDLLLVGTLHAVSIASSNGSGICNGNSTLLTASSTNSYTYTWSPATGLSATSGNIVTASPTVTTTYTVTGTISGNSTTKSYEVVVKPVPTDVTISASVSPTGADACSQDYAKLDASGGLNSNIVAFSENFSGSPSWAYTSINGVQAYYYTSNTAGGTSPEGGIQYVSNANDSWSFYPATSTHNYLPIDIANFTTLNLSFKHNFSRFPGSYTRGIYVDVSTNATSWTNVWSVTPIGSSIASTTVNINLSAYVGASNLYFRFRYTGESAGMYYWIMDDILLSGNKEIITWTPLTGLYTNATLATPYTGTNTKTVYAAPSSTTLYTAMSTLNGCPKTAQVTVHNERKTFTGAISSDWNTPGNWTPAGVPTILSCITIPTSAVVNASADSKSILINSGGNLKVNSGYNITVVDAVSVQSGGTFTLENTASLVQEGTTNLNSGLITVKRTAKPMKRYDFTYWSSPVASQTLYNLSSGTLADKYYSWNPVTQGWLTHMNGSATMDDAKGYIVRAPQSFPVNTVNPIDFVGTFIGKPNNGDITIDVKGNTSTLVTDYKWNLIGNPYPSAIKIDKFLTDNSTKVNGTIYLWTHNSPPSTAITGDNAYNYTSSDYAAYNGVGGTATSAATVNPLHPVVNPSPNTAVPTGYIASGQSFFIRGKANATVKFTNDMREKINNNQFFRSANQVNQVDSIEKNRFWINIRNEEGAFNQALIGYVQGATNDVDEQFDGEPLGGNYVTIYSLVNDKKMTIQGRGLPFINTDLVTLGLKTTISGSFTISLDMFDGLFANQDIFLKDKLLNTIHDLKTGGYSFATTVGTFEDRFEIVYQNSTLEIENPDFNLNSILIYKNNNTIIVNSGVSTMSNVKVFDIQGKLLYDAKNINSSEAILKNLPAVEQVLIVQVETVEGNLVSKKIIF